MTDLLLLPMAQAMASVYLPTSQPKWQNQAATCHVFLGEWNGVPTIAFEGTTDWAEWMEDFNPLEVPAFTPEMGRVHWPSLNNVMAVLPAIMAYLDSINRTPVYLLGHSKGAREAPVCHALLKANGYPVLAGYYFEAPRVGGERLAHYLAGENVTLTQTQNAAGDDIFTLIPNGPGWCDVRVPVALKVPDTLGVRDKHVMSGVLAGIAGLHVAAD